MNKIIPIFKKARKKLWLARYLALPACGAGRPLMLSSRPPLRSGVHWCLLESSSVGVRSV
jgi:hypothetical protein